MPIESYREGYAEPNAETDNQGNPIDRDGKLVTVGLYKKKNQAAKEGGLILTISNDNAVGNTSDGLSSVGKVSDNLETGNENGGRFSLSEREDDGLKDILTNGELNLDERMTETALKLSNEHKDDRSLRINAMRAIGGNLTKLRQAMSLQRFGRPAK